MSMQSMTACCLGVSSPCQSCSSRVSIDDFSQTRMTTAWLVGGFSSPPTVQPKMVRETWIEQSGV